MTREETQKILMTVQALFPNYNPPNKTVVVNAWFEMFSEYTYGQVSAALKTYAATETSGFAPTAGQLIDKIQMITQPQRLNEMEAWSLVSKAIRNGFYGAEEEYEKLPVEVQKAVGSSSQIRQWALSNIESVETVIQSNFMRTYKIVCQREKEVSKLPSSIRNLISSTNKPAAIEAKNEKVIEDRHDYSKECIPMPERAKKRLKEIFD